jgi:hypothetical protein
MSTKLVIPPTRTATPIVSRHPLLPFALFGLMEAAAFLLHAVLPLRGLWFHEALLTVMGSWVVLPSLLLFPGWRVLPPLPHITIQGPPSIPLSTIETLILFITFIVIFIIYTQVVRILPRFITYRYIAITTLVLGFTFALIPIVTSSDLYSYIAYARMAVIYHLNPLTTLPTAIPHDVIYNYVAWKDQPSAYGPVWAMLTSALQWLTLIFNAQYTLPMLIALRLLGLTAHLTCTFLLWRISERLSPFSQHRRLQATLAFAWNPLLLLESCVNAHVDVVVLLCILLALWFLLQPSASNTRTILLSTATLAIATGIKLNVLLLFPFLLLFLWLHSARRLQTLMLANITYLGILILLYAPFWQHGALLNLLRVSPVTARNINSPAEFAAFLYDSINTRLGHPISTFIGSPAEHLTHTLTLGAFGLLYLALCWYILRHPGLLSTPRGLIRVLAIAWLLYCLCSPWFWPWYLVPFFGLYTLLDATTAQHAASIAVSSSPSSIYVRVLTYGRTIGEAFLSPQGVSLLALSMIGMYCFYSWSFSHSFVPGLPGLQWEYLNGLYIWLLPLLAVVLSRRQPKTLRREQLVQQQLEREKR